MTDFPAYSAGYFALRVGGWVVADTREGWKAQSEYLGEEYNKLADRWQEQHTARAVAVGALREAAEYPAIHPLRDRAREVLASLGEEFSEPAMTDGYKKARGASPPGKDLPEERIRRLRDGDST